MFLCVFCYRHESNPTIDSFYTFLSLSRKNTNYHFHWIIWLSVLLEISSQVHPFDSWHAKRRLVYCLVSFSLALQNPVNTTVLVPVVACVNKAAEWNFAIWNAFNHHWSMFSTCSTTLEPFVWLLHQEMKVKKIHICKSFEFGARVVLLWSDISRLCPHYYFLGVLCVVSGPQEHLN